MTDTVSATAGDELVYLNVYTLHQHSPDSEPFVESGHFVECLGTCTVSDMVDTLLELPARAPRPDHFILVQSHPGEDFTASSSDESAIPSEIVGYDGEAFTTPPSPPA